MSRIGRPPKSPVQYIVDSGGCWIWQRAVAGEGYGVLWNGERMVYAHRHFYERENGTLSAGLQLHHLCEQTLCCNPAHLEPVTSAEHHDRHRLDACRRGHPMDDENTYIAPSGVRQCRTCKRAVNARYDARRRAA